MTLTTEKLRTVAEWLWRILDDPTGVLAMLKPEWLLSPDGRDAIEKRLQAMGYCVHSSVYPKGDLPAKASLWRASECFRDGYYCVTAADGYSPSEALLLVCLSVLELAKANSN